MAMAYEHNADQVSDPNKEYATEADVKLAKKWHKRLKQADRHFDRWWKDAERIVKRYRDERTDMASNTGKRFNIFWSNIQVLQPATYSKTAKIYVSRRYQDRDPVARVASQVLQRAVSFQMDIERYHDTTIQARDDFLIVGRGVHWQRYQANVVSVPPAEDPETGEPPNDLATGQPMAPTEKLEEEAAPTDYVSWRDFRHDPKSVWAEVKWVSRDVLMTRAECEKAGFDPECLDRLSYTHRKMDEAGDRERSRRENDGEDGCAKIYEVWDKDTMMVLWLSPDVQNKVLKQSPDFLKLRDFFPCQPPVYATMTTDSLKARADYVMYQDQAVEIDNLTKRIDLLTKAIAVRGAYDKSAPALGTLLKETMENFLVGVDQWAAFAEKGGLKGCISFLPVEEVIKVVAELIKNRQQLIQDIYQISGISDIVRGQTQPHETATAQSIKGNFATLRIEDRRNTFSQFIRNGLALKAEIIAEHFEESNLRKMSGFDVMTEVEQLGQMHGPEAVELLWGEVIKLLKDDHMRMFHLEVETDSTVQIDKEAEQLARTSFLKAVSEFIIGLGPIVMQFPPMLPLFFQMLKFGMRSFQVGAELESTLEATEAQVMAMMQNQAGGASGGDPAAEAEKAKADAEIEGIKAQTAADKEKHQLEMQHQQQKNQMDMQSSAQKTQIQMQQAQQAARQKQMQMMMQAAQPRRPQQQPGGRR